MSAGRPWISGIDDPSARRSQTPLATPGAVPPISIIDYQFLRVIGQGSYGQVWLAKSALGIYRAIKVVFRSSFKDERPFERELSGILRFERVSRLHEGFLEVIEVGIQREAGLFYYVMELGDDELHSREVQPEQYSPKSLASEIARRGRLSVVECLQLGVSICEALVELHRQSLIHRDIKPSNILFVDGKPKLADIGLVADLSNAGSYVGTEGFIPPEGPGSVQADLYSLGKVLYEASTGRDRQDFPELPIDWDRSTQQEISLELNEIILGACQKDPLKRYASASAMQADLLMVINGKSVRQQNSLVRRRATLKRVVLTVPALLAIGGVAWLHLRHELREGAKSRARAASASVTEGNRAVAAGDPFAALSFFAEALRLERGDSEKERANRLRVGSVLAQCPRLTHMWTSTVPVDDAEFSPDNRSVLYLDFLGRAEIRDLESGELRPHNLGLVYGVSFSPSAALVLTFDESCNAVVRDSSSFQELVKLPHPGKIYSGRFSPDGFRLVTACQDGRARIWNTQTGQLEFTSPPHAEALLFATFNREGTRIATAGQDQVACVWDVINGQLLGEPLRHEGWVTCVSFSPDGRWLITAGADHRVRLWGATKEHVIQGELRHDDVVSWAEFSPDGRLILTASYDGMVRLWPTDDEEFYKPIVVLRHGERVLHATFSPDGRSVLTSCQDGAVRIWDLCSTAQLPQERNRVFSLDGRRFAEQVNGQVWVCDTGNGRPVSGAINVGNSAIDLRLNANGRYLLSLSVTNSDLPFRRLAQLWRVEDGERIDSEILLDTPYTNALLSESGKRLLAYGANDAMLWDLEQAGAAHFPSIRGKPIHCACFNSLGNLLATSSENQVEVWSVPEQHPLYAPLSHTIPVLYEAFSHDGRFLVTCCSDPGLSRCTAQIWDAATGQLIGNPLQHSDGVLSASFSHDDAQIVTACEDFSARVWDAKTTRQIGSVLLHRNLVRAAVFSPDDKWIATASADRTARIWDVQSHEPLTPPLKHFRPLKNVQFLADGTHIVTSDVEGKSYTWDLCLEQRSNGELLELTQLLSGGPISTNVSRASNSCLSNLRIWKTLKTRYPEIFTVSKEEIRRWHELQAQESELRGQWPAAEFHLKWLLHSQPGDLQLFARIATAQSHGDRMH